MDPPKLAPTPRPVVPAALFAYGRLVADKGFDVALRAFAIVRQRHPKACMTIAGDGPARADLERLAAMLGLTACVGFVGVVPPDAVPKLLNEATVVIVPSRWDEPFGLVALEAALMERPVVATRVGGLVEAVEDEVTGLLVSKDDPDALAAAVLALLDDAPRADAMGQAGRARARDLFAWDRCVAAYDQLYKTVALEAAHAG
jgi:glycogen(starch) synthase